MDRLGEYESRSSRHLGASYYLHEATGSSGPVRLIELRVGRVSEHERDRRDRMLAACEELRRLIVDEPQGHWVRIEGPVREDDRRVYFATPDVLTRTAFDELAAVQGDPEAASDRLRWSLDATLAGLDELARHRGGRGHGRLGEPSRILVDWGSRTLRLWGLDVSADPRSRPPRFRDQDGRSLGFLILQAAGLEQVAVFRGEDEPWTAALGRLGPSWRRLARQLLADPREQGTTQLESAAAARARLHELIPPAGRARGLARLVLEHPGRASAAAGVVVLVGGGMTLVYRAIPKPTSDPPKLVVSQTSLTVNEDAPRQTVRGFVRFQEGPGGSTLRLQSYDVSLSPGDGTKFETKPSIDNNGTLTYTPAGNAWGEVAFTVKAIFKDNKGTQIETDLQLVTLTINPINDPPSFEATNPQPSNEDVGRVTVPNWATNFNPGPYEDNQIALEYRVTIINNSGLFAEGPSVDRNGNLTYTPADNASGTATFELRVRDNGGTVSGGEDTSAPQTIKITVDSVNDAPTVTLKENPITVQSSERQIVDGFVIFKPGPDNESEQKLQPPYGVQLSESDADKFAMVPTVDDKGNLSFRPKAGATGKVVITVTAQDNGGTDNGGVDSSDPVSAEIILSGTIVSPNQHPEAPPASPPPVSARPFDFDEWKNTSAIQSNDDPVTYWNRLPQDFPNSQNIDAIIKVATTLYGNTKDTPKQEELGTRMINVLAQVFSGSNAEKADQRWETVKRAVAALPSDLPLPRWIAFNLLIDDLRRSADDGASTNPPPESGTTLSKYLDRTKGVPRDQVQHDLAVVFKLMGPASEQSEISPQVFLEGSQSDVLVKYPMEGAPLSFRTVPGYDAFMGVSEASLGILDMLTISGPTKEMNLQLYSSFMRATGYDEANMRLPRTYITPSRAKEIAKKFGCTLPELKWYQAWWSPKTDGENVADAALKAAVDACKKKIKEDPNNVRAQDRDVRWDSVFWDKSDMRSNAVLMDETEVRASPTGDGFVDRDDGSVGLRPVGQGDDWSDLRGNAAEFAEGETENGERPIVVWGPSAFGYPPHGDWIRLPRTDQWYSDVGFRLAFRFSVDNKEQLAKLYQAPPATGPGAPPSTP